MSESEIGQAQEVPMTETPGADSPPPAPAAPQQRTPARPQIGDTRPARPTPATPLAPVVPLVPAAPTGSRVRDAGGPAATSDGRVRWRRADDDGTVGRAALAQPPALGTRSQGQAGRALPGLRARAAGDDPDRHVGGAIARRALRLAGGRRHQSDRRQRLPGPGPERPPGHGGRLRRHRHPQERRPLPGGRPLRPGRHRGWGPRRPSPGSRTCSRRARPSCAR